MGDKMPRVKKICHCQDCPFVYEDATLNPWCMGVSKGTILNRGLGVGGDSWPSKQPEWCPLREQVEDEEIS